MRVELAFFRLSLNLDEIALMALHLHHESQSSLLPAHACGRWRNAKCRCSRGGTRQRRAIARGFKR